MAVRVGINGLGRIGRCVLRSYIESKRTDIEVVAVNFRTTSETKAHLIKYDSTHGTLNAEIKYDDNSLTIDGKKIHRFKGNSPSEINWKEAGVDMVLECTGVFTKRADAAKHFDGGAKKVIISAPSNDSDAMIVLGVNDDKLKKEHQIISIGSCTTNCLAPVAKVLNEAIGIESGFMTTVHAFTSDQNLLDNNHKDLRRARTATASMIPTSTGAAKSIGKVLPELEGKLDGVAVRVPTQNVSLVDFVFNAGRNTSKDEINEIMRKAAAGKMKGILDICNEPLVSIDFSKNPHSSIFDTTQTVVLKDKLCRIAAWYDNEWAFSVRMLDVAAIFK